MVTSKRMAAAEPGDVATSRFWRWLIIVGLGTVSVFLVGIVLGFTSAHFDRGGGAFNTRGVLILSGLALAIALCLWILVRQLRKPTGEEPLTRKERLNRNILIGSGLTGGVFALVIALAEQGGPRSGVFSNEPLPTAVALVLVLILGVVMPAVSIFWHRSVVDEQEADAYKTGAMYGLYVFMVGAPVWWLSWRGGFAPPPNGFVIYMASILTILPVWFWKKYR